MTTNAARAAPERQQSTVMKHLRRLVEATGPSGSEEDVIRIVADLARPYADSIEIDAFGNVTAVRRAAQEGARQCVVSAHMDEIGFRVRKIEPGGFLRLEKVGGSDDRILPAQRVWVRTETDRLLGVIGTKSAHLLADGDRTTVVPYAQLYVDVGARSEQEAAEMGIVVGDPVGFVGSLDELGKGSGRYTAHALDDRAGCALLITLLERLKNSPLPVTLVAVFSVQEEVGLRGVEALSKHLQVTICRRSRPSTPLSSRQARRSSLPRMKRARACSTSPRSWVMPIPAPIFSTRRCIPPPAIRQRSNRAN